MTGDNAPPPDGWVCTPRACPFDPCYVCQPHEGGGAYPPPIPANVVLGAE